MGSLGREIDDIEPASRLKKHIGVILQKEYTTPH